MAASGKGEEEIVEQIQDAFSFGAFDFKSGTVEELEDEYFDTADFALNAQLARGAVQPREHYFPQRVAE